MASDKDRFIALVAKLIELTQDGKLKWLARKPRTSLSHDAEMAVDVVYVADYEGKTLGLYQVRHKWEAPASGSLSAVLSVNPFSMYGIDTPKYSWNTVLEFIDSSGNCLWTFPEVSGLSDLFKAVQYQVAGVKKFLDDVLGPESK